MSAAGHPIGDAHSPHDARVLPYGRRRTDHPTRLVAPLTALREAAAPVAPAKVVDLQSRLARFVAGLEQDVDRPAPAVLTAPVVELQQTLSQSVQAITVLLEQARQIREESGRAAQAELATAYAKAAELLRDAAPGDDLPVGVDVEADTPVVGTAERRLPVVDLTPPVLDLTQEREAEQVVIEHVATPPATNPAAPFQPPFRWRGATPA